MKGNDLIITAAYNGKNYIYAAKSCDIVVDIDLTETASPDTAEWKEYITGRRGWQATSSYLVGDEKMVDDVLMVGRKVAVTCKARYEHGGVNGYAYVKQCRITGTRGNLVQGTFTLIGTGQLAK